VRRIRASRSLLGAVVFALVGTGCAKAGVTDQAHQVHNLYVAIVIMALPVFLVVEFLLIFIVVKYRKRDDAPAPQHFGTNKTLAVFFVIPLLIVSLLYAYGETTLASVSKEDPNPQVLIRVEGFQWEWTFYYLNEGFFTTGKTFPGPPAVMVVPIGVPVHIQLESRDVIHSFFVPDFLFKRDVIPGRHNEFSFTATQLGTYQGQCAEFCGLLHNKMTFTLRVVTMPDYLTWVEQQKTAALNQSCPVTGSTITVTAKDTAWNTSCLAVTANNAISLTVSNQDAGIDHNFAIYDTPQRAQELFVAGRFPGVATQSFTIPALPAGKYYFQCDVHGPSMSGTFIVGP
jgi:cytochrome c oxidase subunit II